MGRLFILKEVTGPDQVRNELADPKRQWREGYSACELARSWLADPDSLPPPVKRVLDTHPRFASAELVEAFFERKVDLGTSGRSSQNDAIAYCVSPATRFVAAVEGKVKEKFGPLVFERTPDPSQDVRITSLCSQLGVSPGSVLNIRYQLMHRAVSALREARRYRVNDALLLVHSFDAMDSSLSDYQAFAELMGLPRTIALPNQVCGDREIDGIRFHMAWVREVPPVPNGYGLKCNPVGLSDETMDFDSGQTAHTKGTDSQKTGEGEQTKSADLPQATQILIDRILASHRSPKPKETSVVSSNVSSGFKKALRGEDYKTYYGIELRRTVAELGAYTGIQIPLLVELVVLLKDESESIKERVFRALKGLLQ